MNHSTRRRLAVSASIATILGLGVAIWTGWDDSEFESTSDTDDSSVDVGRTDCLVVSQGNESTVSVKCGDQDASTDSVADWEALRETKPWTAGTPPTSDGPWPFVVGGTGGQGLYVRDGFKPDSQRLPGEPSLVDGETTYAYCQTTTGWEAVPGYGTTWMRIGYPQPSSRGDSWVYAWWTAPVEHNGEIPICTP